MPGTTRPLKNISRPGSSILVTGRGDAARGFPNQAASIIRAA
jgi:hypothetical protein